MSTENRRISQYDAYAQEYAASVAQREQGDAGDDLGILPHLLALLGEVTGRRVLDAGCGEGYLARILAARGAQVTGIDLSPQLIALARAKDSAGAIEYRVADLSAPLSADAGRLIPSPAIWSLMTWRTIGVSRRQWGSSSPRADGRCSR